MSHPTLADIRLNPRLLTDVPAEIVLRGSPQPVMVDPDAAWEDVL